MTAITSTPTLPTTDLPELEALVRCIEATAAEATRVTLGAYATQIRELHHAAGAALAEARSNAADIPGDLSKWGNLGEGYWEVVICEIATKDALRFAQEARHWLHSYRVAEQRLAEGKPAVSWTVGDPDLEAERERVELGRIDMEHAQ
ncbi:MAG TPA: hypothetical protein VNL35_16710 [Chloroflexota bacterium]|nr:hypothetical protein [Chloroflexota bacterium]